MAQIIALEWQTPISKIQTVTCLEMLVMMMMMVMQWVMTGTIALPERPVGTLHQIPTMTAMVAEMTLRILMMTKMVFSTCMMTVLKAQLGGFQQLKMMKTRMVAKT